ncbi:MAG: TlpA disulfide reductase family protein [Ferruginibacter sp.]
MKYYFLFLTLFISNILQIQAQTATITGEIYNPKGDTIKIVLLENPIIRQSETYSIPVKNDRFSYNFLITKPTYFYTNDGSNYISGLLEPNDSVVIIYDAENIISSLRISGKGSAKTAFANSLTQVKLYRRFQEQLPFAKANKHPFDYLFNYADSIGNVLSNKLDSIKSSMSFKSYNLLKADINAILMGNKYRSVGLVYNEGIAETLSKRKDELTQTSEEHLRKAQTFDSTLFYSSSYINEVYNILSLEYDGLVLSNQITKGVVKKYDYLNSRLPSSLRIPVLTLFFSHDIDNFHQNTDTANLQAVIEQTYQEKKDSVYKSYIDNRFQDAISFRRGTDAPDFTLENENDDKVSLSSFKGKVIYLDFWYAACGPCHILFEAIKPVKKYYSKNESVVFLTVSIDSRKVWKEALKKYNIAGYNVFTENKGESHPIIKAYKVAGFPSTYLIDRDGKIFMTNPSNNPQELQKEIEDALTTKSN